MRKLKLEELGRTDIEGYKTVEKLPVIVVLDNVRSAFNVGSVFRTCDGLAISELILTGITAQPPHKEINKSAIGSTNSVDWSHHESIYDYLNTLDKESHQLIGIEQTDKSIPLISFTEHISDNKTAVLVFGNEVAGVSDEVLPLLDQCIEIQQYGTKHSFNVSVCAGMILWEFSKQLRT